MIIPQDTPAKVGSYNASPPTYEYQGYSAIPTGPARTPAVATSSTPVFFKVPIVRNYRARACRRFWTALLIATGIYLLAATVLTLRHSDSGRWEDVDPQWPDYTSTSGDWKVNPDGCSTSWDDANGPSITTPLVVDSMEMPDQDLDGIINASHRAHLTATLALDQVKYLLVGNRAYGAIEFTTSANEEQQDITVHITAQYYRESVLEKVRVCKLQGKQGGEGLGIYLPKRFGKIHREDQVTFNIAVIFPSRPSELGPLHINSFETHFSIMHHSIRDLRSRVHFSDINLASSNAGLQSEGLEAEHVYLRTSNAMISGDYRTNGSMVLETSNGKIDVALALEDHGRLNGGIVASLKTSNGGITAKGNLIYLGEDGSLFKNGRFSLDARTSNSPLVLSLPSLPFGSTLKLDGRTSNGLVDVRLDNRGSFEGSFQAETSSYMGIPTVERADGRDDNGKGLRRILEKTIYRRGNLSGKVYWGKWEPGRDGDVKLRTSNAKVYLSI